MEKEGGNVDLDSVGGSRCGHIRSDTASDVRWLDLMLRSGLVPVARECRQSARSVDPLTVNRFLYLKHCPAGIRVECLRTRCGTPTSMKKPAKLSDSYLTMVYINPMLNQACFHSLAELMYHGVIHGGVATRSLEGQDECHLMLPGLPMVLHIKLI